MSARIIVTEGPYQLENATEVVVRRGSSRDGFSEADLSGALDGQGQAWLCRCGASSMKPACDGSHHECGFAGEDTGRPLHTWPSGGASPTLTFTTGSALEIEGVDVVLQDGSLVPMAGKAAVLCRCGASSIKPGCDGTCREIGFAD